jgi:uncharacterized protein (DUF1501 family)
MHFSRRNFLKLVGRSTATVSAGAAMTHFGAQRALAQVSSDYKALVCIFLFGGNDSNNMVIPISTTKNSYADYSRIRSGLAHAQNVVLPISGNSETYGLHPKLTAVADLYNRGKAAMMLNVGTLSEPITKTEYLNKTKKFPANLLSHSDQQSQWQSSDTSGFGTTGWGGRLADYIGPKYNIVPAGAQEVYPAAVSVAGGSLFATGAVSSPAMVTTAGPSKPNNWPATPDARVTAFQNLLQFSNGLTLVNAANKILSAGLTDSVVLSDALATSKFNPTFPNNNTLASQLKMVAQVIAVQSALGASRQIFFVSMGGYDTHTTLLNQQNTNLTQVNDAIDAFYKALESLTVENQVTTFVESDFNRTNQPNGTAGSDHAWGSHQFVFGGVVKGGIYGSMPTLALNGPDDISGRGVYIPSTAVDQYGATMARWLGVGSADLATVFPNLGKFASANLGFLG